MSGFVPSAFFPVNGGGGLPVPELDPPTFPPSTGDYVIGGYHDFDGVDEEIDFGRITAMEMDAGDPFTVSAWIEVNAAQSMVFEIYDGVDNNIFVYADGLFNLRMDIKLDGNNYSAAVSQNLSSGWHHVLVASSGTAVSFYIDGASKSIASSTGSYPTASATWSGTTKVRIGGPAGGFYFQGQIAEVAMWSTDQSANIGAIYNFRFRHNLMDLATPPDLFYAPLTSYGDDPGSGGSVSEVVANNDGTGVNMETADAVIPTVTEISSILTKTINVSTSVVTSSKAENIITGATGGTGSSFP